MKEALKSHSTVRNGVGTPRLMLRSSQHLHARGGTRCCTLPVVDATQAAEFMALAHACYKIILHLLRSGSCAPFEALEFKGTAAH